MDTAATAAPTSTHGLTAGVHRVVDQTDQLLTSASATGGQALNEARDRFGVQIRQMRAQLDHLEDVAMSKAKHAARSADRSVHDHPHGAMGLAAAAGLLIRLPRRPALRTAPRRRGCTVALARHPVARRVDNLRVRRAAFRSAPSDCGDTA